jgi:hypothetical protein
MANGVIFRLFPWNGREVTDSFLYPERHQHLLNMSRYDVTLDHPHTRTVRMRMSGAIRAGSRRANMQSRDHTRSSQIQGASTISTLRTYQRSVAS